MKKLHFISFIAVLWLSSCSPLAHSTINSSTSSPDYLVYSIYEHSEPPKLVFYDLANDTRSQILQGWKVKDFSFSPNNRLAFSSSQEGVNNVYILEFPFTKNKPTKISIDPASDFGRLSWSPDGHYLLFDAVQGDDNKLILWDGKEISEIYHYHQQVGGIAWSSSNQLAFTDFYTFIFPHEGDSSEVFIWDGNSTVNASQNPDGEDRFPTWSEDGRLAFLSDRNGEHDIFIWDGVSKNNGLPDTNTFINIAPDLTHYYSDLTWTNTGTLAFQGSDAWDLSVQIYEWDGQTATNISRNPLDNNGGQTWRSDGYWSFVTYFSDTQILYIRDEKNRTVLKTKGQYTPAWSQNGLLMFCVNQHPDWTLAIWNGKEVINVTQGNTIIAKWQNGAGVYCSNG